MSSEKSGTVNAKQLNSHGDALVETTGHHGPDIASQRIDELDGAALRFAEEISARVTPAVAVDLGAGLGAQTARFAAAGLSVLMVDLAVRPEWLQSVNSQHPEPRVSAFAGDVCQMPEDAMPRAVHLLYSQRMIHYLRYPAAVGVLSSFAARMGAGARLFLSCACLDSELSQGYSESGKRVDERFGALAPELAKKHGVVEPLCLYSEAEFVRLAEESGFSAMKVWRSEFGTLKGVFGRR